MTAATETTFWIKTEPTVDGKGFVVNVEVGEDQSFTLTPDEAFKHARVLLEACAYAEYDASVYQQMVGKVGGEAAFQLCVDLQTERAPLDVGGTYPFMYVPGLTKEDREPVIQIRIEGTPVGLWGLKEAREHAFVLVEAPSVADLDSAYLRVLRGS